MVEPKRDAKDWIELEEEDEVWSRWRRAEQVSTFCENGAPLRPSEIIVVMAFEKGETESWRKETSGSIDICLITPITNYFCLCLFICSFQTLSISINRLVQQLTMHWGDGGIPTFFNKEQRCIKIQVEEDSNLREQGEHLYSSEPTQQPRYKILIPVFIYRPAKKRLIWLIHAETHIERV